MAKITQRIILGSIALLCLLQGRSVAQVTLAFTDEGNTVGGWYGMSLAPIGDVNNDQVPDLVVGAPGIFGTIPNLGYARVVSGADGTTLHTVIGVNTLHNFGAAVAGLDDLNGDGIPEFCVSAPGFSANGARSGRLRIYSGFDASLIHVLDGQFTGEEFGTSVCCLGDIDGDGISDFAVGSEGTSPIAPNPEGAVQVFSGATASLIHVINDVDGLGISIDDCGDIDGDGISDIICGLPNASVNHTRDGRARLYSGATAQLLQESVGTAQFDHYGTSVAGLGDVNGDDIPDYGCGGPGLNNSTFNNEGFARIISGADGSVIYAYSGQTGDYMGNHLSGVGDVNGDGRKDFAIGASGAHPDHMVVYSGQDGSVLWSIAGATSSSPFGNRSSPAGDLNGDGFSDFFVSNPTEDGVVGNSAGQIRVYHADTHPVLSYESTAAPTDIRLEWLPDGGDINALTGTIRAIGATPFFSTGVYGSSLAPSEFVVANVPILIANDSVNLIDSGPITYGFLGELVVPGISRQNPFIAGVFIHLQLFEFSPVIRSSNALRWLMVP